MTIEAALAALDADGVELSLKSGRLHARPAGRISTATAGLVRAHADELRWRLGNPIDFIEEQAALLQGGIWILCHRCRFFSARPASRPDGLCSVHGQTWARVPLPCRDFTAASVSNREQTGRNEAAA
jgi:hypothetical protein